MACGVEIDISEKRCIFNVLRSCGLNFAELFYASSLLLANDMAKCVGGRNRYTLDFT